MLASLAFVACNVKEECSRENKLFSANKLKADIVIDLNYKDLKRANHKELKSRATYTAVYKWMRCFTYSILQFELYLLAKGNCFSGSVIRI